MEWLEREPRQHPNIKPLKGDFAGYHRYRIGDYRVLYRIDDGAMQVLVDKIEHRSKIYRS